MKKVKNEYQYQMTAEMARSLLGSRSKNESKIDNQKWLCDYVNLTYGLMGTCTEVLLTL